MASLSSRSARGRTPRTSTLFVRLPLRVSLQRSRAHFGAVDVPLAVSRDTLRGARSGCRLVGVRDEGHHLTVADLPDANAALPSGMVASDRSRFGIGHVDGVGLVDENPARAAELRPLVEDLAVLIENLNPVVVAIP